MSDESVVDRAEAMKLAAETQNILVDVEKKKQDIIESNARVRKSDAETLQAIETSQREGRRIALSAADAVWYAIMLTIPTDEGFGEIEQRRKSVWNDSEMNELKQKMLSLIRKF